MTHLLLSPSLFPWINFQHRNSTSQIVFIVFVVSGASGEEQLVGEAKGTFWCFLFGIGCRHRRWRRRPPPSLSSEARRRLRRSTTHAFFSLVAVSRCHRSSLFFPSFIASDINITYSLTSRHEERTHQVALSVLNPERKVSVLDSSVGLSFFFSFFSFRVVFPSPPSLFASETNKKIITTSATCAGPGPAKTDDEG